MKIFSKKGKILIELDKGQDSLDAGGNVMYRIDNIIGVITKDKLSLNKLIDMGYASKTPQVGMEIVIFDGNEKDFLESCRRIKIPFIRYPSCSKCNSVLYGTHTIDERGKDVCLECMSDDGLLHKKQCTSV